MEEGQIALIFKISPLSLLLPEDKSRKVKSKQSRDPNISAHFKISDRWKYFQLIIRYLQYDEVNEPIRLIDRTKQIDF